MVITAPPENHLDLAGEGFSDEDWDPRPKKKKPKRSAKATLDQTGRIESNKQDIRFDIDPLFVKTAEKFDERGTGSLLLHQLEVPLAVEVLAATRVVCALLR